MACKGHGPFALVVNRADDNNVYFSECFPEA
jgi:hypothetical protein